ncbi:MAG: PAS domain S-box protein, partial [Cytophagia bacterium]
MLNETMKLKKKYIYSALSLVFLIVVNQIIIQYILFQKKEDAKLINVAGRQRMLSQRVNLMIYRLSQDSQYTSDDKLKLVLTDWKKSHLALINGNTQMAIAKIESKEIAIKVKQAFKKIEEIESLIYTAPTISKAQREKINAIVDLFLEEMEIIVLELEDFSNRKLYTIMFVELLIAFISLLFIYFELREIIFPILKKLDKDLITLQLQFEDLKETKNKLRVILDSTTDSNILISPDYKILSFNKRANKGILLAYGKPLEEMADVWEYIPSPNREAFYDSTQKALKGEYLTFEKEIFFGQLTVWCELTYYPAYDSEGKILGVTFNVTNIDKRKQAELRLKETKNKLRAILDSTTDSNILISPDYKILSFNKRANEVSKLDLGKPLEELADIWEYISSQNKELFYNSTQKALKGEYLKFEKEIYFKQFSAWCEIAYYPAYDNEGKILGVTFNNTNIDARKKVEIQLKQSEAMLRALYDSRSEASTFIDRDLCIIFNNKLAQEITKNIFGREAVKGDRSLDFMIPELQEEFLDYYKRVLAGESIKVEKEHQGKWWRFSLYPVYDSENNIIGIADNVKDVTGRVQNELKIHKQNENLQKIAWQQSHEVRRPLATILGLCDLITTDETATVEEQQQYIDHIVQSAQELDAIIHKIV